MLGPLPEATARQLGRALGHAAANELDGAAVTSVSFGTSPSAWHRPPDSLESLDAIARRFGALRLRHRGPARSVVFAVGGSQALCGADVALATGLDVLNPELRLATLGPCAGFEVTLMVEPGRGHRARPAHTRQDGFVSLPARFSPLVSWCDHVEGDQLHIELETDGQMTPQQLLQAAGQLLPAELRAVFETLDTVPLPLPEPAAATVTVPITFGRAPRALEVGAAVRESFAHLVEHALAEEIGRRFPLDGPSGRRRLAFANVVAVPPAEPPSAALTAGESWLGEILVGVEVHGVSGETVVRRRLRWASVPWLTPRGTFVIDGLERVCLGRVVTAADGSYRLQRGGGQLTELLRRRHDERLDQVIDGLDTDVDPQELLPRLQLTNAWLEWLRHGPTVELADTTQAAALAEQLYQVRCQAHEAAALHLTVCGDGLAREAADDLGRTPAQRCTTGDSAAGLLTALPLVWSEPPRVATGCERELGQVMDLVAPHPGLLEASDGLGVTLRDTVLDAPAFAAGRDVAWSWRLREPVGTRVEAGARLADGPGTVDGGLALGCGLLVGFARDFQGPGAVASDRLLLDDCLTSVHRMQLVCPLASEFTLTRATARDPRHLDQRGVVRPGTLVQPGDVLVGRYWRHNNSDASLRCPDTGEPWQVAEVLEVSADRWGQAARLVLVLMAERRLSTGDRLATRAAPLAEVMGTQLASAMPRLADGRALDLVVPGLPGEHRTELALGLIALTRGRRMLVAPGGMPGAHEIGAMWQEAGLPAASHLGLTDGRSGAPLGDGWTAGLLHVLKTRRGA